MLRKIKLSIPIFGVLAILAATTLIKAPVAHAMAGVGTTSNPYQISTCQDLQDIKNNMYSNYIVTNDIDCSSSTSWNGGEGFIPIGGNDGGFQGTFDGQNHTISDLYINTPDLSYAGLFGRTYNTTIKNVTLDNAEIHGVSAYKTGVLIGEVDISFVYNIHILNATVIGNNQVGMLLGSSINTTISGSSSSGAVSSSSNSPKIGGLIGEMVLSTLINSYSTANLSTTSTFADLGGLSGYSNSSLITKSYAAGSITSDASSANLISGLAMGQELSDNFVTTSLQNAHCDTNYCGAIVSSVYNGFAGGLSNYYDQTAVGVSNCGSTTCTAVNTDGLDPDHFSNNTTNAPLSGWNFTDVWQADVGLPTLRLNAPVETAAPAPTNITTETLSGSSFSVSWDPVNDPNVTGYEIHVSGVDNANELYNGSLGYEQVGVNETNYTVTGMPSGSNFNVSVSAMYTAGAPVASEPAEAHTTLPGFSVVNTCQQLQDITNGLNDNYEITRDIDCSDTVNWNNGAGFIPIGLTVDNHEPAIFQGIVYGNNHTITGLYQNSKLAGLFGLVVGTIQDIKLDNPNINVMPESQSDETIGGTVAGYLYLGGTLTNVHVVNGSVNAQNGMAVGGLAGIIYFGGVVSHSSYQGSISGSPTIAGGLVGQAFINVFSEFGIIPNTISNSYAKVDITLTGAPQDSEFVGAGGLIGFVLSNNGALFDITNSYATGTLDYTDSVVPALLGGIVGVPMQTTVTDSFSRMNFVLPDAGGFAGGVTASSTVTGELPVTNGVYVYNNLSAPNECVAEGDQICTSVSDPNYFNNNSSNPPLDQWDFTNIWQTTSELPIFKSNSAPSPVDTNHTIVPIKDLIKYAPFLFSKSTDVAVPAIAGAGSGSSGSAASRIATAASPDSASSNPISQALASIKEFVQSLPPSVVVAFPYALFGLLGIGILALLIELGYELRRTYLLEALIHKQQLLAEERDAFWHLAANYLRAPVTLIVGGAEALRESNENERTTAISAIAASLQTKVGEIMKKIEGSSSLQAIKSSHEHVATKIARKAIFIVPLSIVAVFVILGDLAATNYRDLNPGFIGYMSQLVIFVLAAVVLYWAIGLVTRGKSKRKATEELLKQQSAELGSARHELIEDTARSLNPDLTKLEAQLAVLPATTATAAVGAIATLRDGSSRLREIVSSFTLLIKVQEGVESVNAGTNSRVDLTGVLGKVRAKLTPQITYKNVHVSAPAVPLAVAAESDMAQQVIESILANAVDYSPAGGTVKVEARQLEDSIQLRISDQGKGIDKKQLDHLFQPFVRADGTSAMDMSHGGFGINLYLDKLIMEQMGGSISAASIPGKGTSITMSWPT